MDWLRGSFSGGDSAFDERFDDIRNIRLLVLDDLGTENATPWVREKIFQIINYRYLNRLPTVITTNLDMQRIEDRISSRLQDTDLVLRVMINAPDFRNPMQDDQSQLSTLHLHSDCTFGSFRLRESEKLPQEEQSSLEKAFQAARQFAENPSGWLIFMGTYGCGKTHLGSIDRELSPQPGRGTHVRGGARTAGPSQGNIQPQQPDILRRAVQPG